MIIELLPCPFCGSHSAGIVRATGSGFYAGCGQCQTSIFYCDPADLDSPKGAIAAWNTRPAPQQPAVVTDAVNERVNQYGEPEAIYLQLHGDGYRDSTGPEDYKNGEVTWCWHSINGDDVRYVRSDFGAAERAQAQQDKQEARMATTPSELPARWLATAEDYASMPAGNVSAAFRQCADELTAALAKDAAPQQGGS